MSDQDPEPSAAPTPSPPLEPFFTLLTNSTTNATIHPRVQYLFSDDDPSILCTASQDPSHRALVVTLAPSDTTWSVAAARALTSEFALTSHTLVKHNDDRSSTLRLDGVERDPLPETEDADALIEEFRRRMQVLKVVAKKPENALPSEDGTRDAVAQT